MTALEERQAIVEWLRIEAKYYQDGASREDEGSIDWMGWHLPAIEMEERASAIERGEHHKGDEG